VKNVSYVILSCCFVVLLCIEKSVLSRVEKKRLCFENNYKHSDSRTLVIVSIFGVFVVLKMFIIEGASVLCFLRECFLCCVFVVLFCNGRLYLFPLIIAESSVDILKSCTKIVLCLFIFLF